jgi:hypothetical protein
VLIKMDEFHRKERKKRQRLLLLAAVLLDSEDAAFRKLLDAEETEEFRGLRS